MLSLFSFFLLTISAPSKLNTPKPIVSVELLPVFGNLLGFIDFPVFLKSSCFVVSITLILPLVLICL